MIWGVSVQPVRGTLRRQIDVGRTLMELAMENSRGRMSGKRSKMYSFGTLTCRKSSNTSSIVLRGSWVYSYISFWILVSVYFPANIVTGKQTWPSGPQNSSNFAFSTESSVKCGRSMKKDCLGTAVKSSVAEEITEGARSTGYISGHRLI